MCYEYENSNIDDGAKRIVITTAAKLIKSQIKEKKITSQTFTCQQKK